MRLIPFFLNLTLLQESLTVKEHASCAGDPLSPRNLVRHRILAVWERVVSSGPTGFSRRDQGQPSASRKQPQERFQFTSQLRPVRVRKR